MQIAPGRSTLFRQGDPAEQLIIVARGFVRVSVVNEKGEALTLRVMEAGDAVGCVAVFRQVPYPASAIAVTDSVALTWPGTWVREAMERVPALRANALDMVGGRMQEMVHRLQETAADRVEQRVARALLRLAEQAGQLAEGGTEIALPLSRQDIAEIAGTDLYVVSRLARRWAAERILAVGRMRVTLLDRKRLAAVAAGAHS